MPFNSIVNRTSPGSGLFPEEVIQGIINGVRESSAVLSRATRLPNMSRAQSRMPVLSSLPTAYFLTGDTDRKQTTDVAWGDKYIDAAELAVIVPIPDAVLDDAGYDIWGEIQPLLIEAFGVAIDAAVLHGTNAPAVWPTDVVAAATAAGNSVTAGGTSATLYDEILGESGVISLLEADGFMATSHVAGMNMRGKLRSVKDADNNPIFRNGMVEGTQYALDGAPITFPKNGAFDTSSAWMISGDWDQMVYSIRQDITFKLDSSASIHDAAGVLQYNLFQQDMTALRAVMRLGWQVPNPINRLQQTEANRYPFSVLLPNA